MLPFTGMAQTDSFPLVSVVGKDLADFRIDNLGNYYLLSQKGELKKLSATGDSVAVFNDVRRFGKLYAMDVSNPLKLILFYRDFGTVVVLDRLLNRRNTIDMRKQQILQAKAVAQSYDNGVWVYDEIDAKLKRLDDNGNVIGETVDFRNVFDDPPSPEQIADADRLVYLYDPNKGLFVLDYFGSVRNKVALLGWTDFQVIGKKVIGRKGTLLESYVPGALQLQEIAMPAQLTGVQKMQVTIDKLYCLKDGSLFIYALNNLSK
ncbi:hypothetical protein FPE01S_01_08290 [Flavihumibacter petaseus NBRC 106054]|uniref:Phytase-like domain-containing protein n=2 Tax=Flavihumibacter TaxID=1004301 RepID=A0A0E9MXG0_9BACT|nr:hypothetical protein FPE01S_01_08290 [Flavihumibacter petaseus NBRC 106054]